jgi:S-adenosylmethionine decarboxylase
LKNPFTLPLAHSAISTADKTVRFTSVPGLHIVANFAVADAGKLTGFQPFKDFIDAQIAQHNLCKVGEVYHNFENGGYTGVVCLTESHLSIHTWPENQYLTFDVFLSNHLKDNRAVTRALYQHVKAYFKATVLLEQIIDR